METVSLAASNEDVNDSKCKTITIEVFSRDR